MDTFLLITVGGTIALVFPIIAAVVAFRKGHPRWGIATIVSIFIGMGWLIGVLAIMQPDERRMRPPGTLQNQDNSSIPLPALEIGTLFQRTRWEIRVFPEWLDLGTLDQQTLIRIPKEEGKSAIGFASLFPWGFNLKIYMEDGEYRFRLASTDLARIRAWWLPLTKSEKALARKQASNHGTQPDQQPSLPLMEVPVMEVPASKQVQPKPVNPIGEALGAGAGAGVFAGVAAHFFSGGQLTFGIWIAAYILVIATVKNKLVATIAFVVVASLVSVLAGILFPAA